MKTYTFRTIIEPDEKGTFHGFVPALAGCNTWGKTIEETKENLKEAIEVYVASLVDDGEEIPQEKGFEFFTTISTNLNSDQKVYA
ncbi:type II toxin-antitoxin system HicB family antitoxin [Patescibacteria group bacterium]